ncbi:MAG TPA: carboxyltransferase domain-containing protein, partial [Isosphaeraceae bacterium]|nr:carboxyltransferase domain-containing protein [Isosphaeraceae bacterium]
MTALVPLGDRSWLARFDHEYIARRWSESIRSRTKDHPGILDVVLAFQTVAVYADPDREDLEALESWLRSAIGDFQGSVEEDVDREPVEIPVLYDGEDLTVVALQLGLSVED